MKPEVCLETTIPIHLSARLSRRVLRGEDLELPPTVHLKN